MELPVKVHVFWILTWTFLDLQQATMQELCSSGSEWVNGACELCQIGFFRTNGLHGETCERCPDNEAITRYRGALTEKECNMSIGSRNECSSGKEWLSSRESCVVCERGTYRVFGVDYWCVACPDGLGTVAPGSTARGDCTDVCTAGTIYSGRKCSLCEVGTFRPQSSPSTECIACPLDQTTLLPGSTTETDCFPMEANEGGFNIEFCPSGTEPDSAVGGCVVCPKGFYRESGKQPDCTACPDDLTTLYPGATNYDICTTAEEVKQEQLKIEYTNGIRCPLGTEYHVIPGAARGCRPCPKGTYRDSKAKSHCWQCFDQTSTSSIGTVLRSLCGANATPGDGHVFDKGSCPPGTEWTPALVMCTECEYGFYKASDLPPEAVCSQCPPKMSTAGTGSTTQSDCSFYIGDVDESKAPFAMPDQCPSGTEWSSSTCIPCPIGYYRQQDTGRVVCASCPEGLTTHDTGSPHADHCSVPSSGPNSMPYSPEIGCLPGYQPDQGWTICSQCPFRTYKMSTGNSSCGYCPFTLTGEPAATRQMGSSSKSQCLKEVSILSISPSNTTRSGQVVMSIQLSSGSQVARIQSVMVGNSECIIEKARVEDDTVTCVIGPSRVDGPSDVIVVLDDGRTLVSSAALTILPDPIITSISRMKTFASGGVDLSVIGQHFHNVQKHVMTIASMRKDETIDATRVTCTSISDSQLTCVSPNVTSWFDGAQRRKRREINGDRLDAHVGFVIGGVRAYRNITDTVPDIGPLVIYTDPIVDTFDGRELHVYYPTNNITLLGSSLNGGTVLGDFAVYINSTPCAVSNLLSTELTCDISTDFIDTFHLNQPYLVQVQIGPLAYEPGSIVFTNTTPTTAPPETSETPNLTSPSTTSTPATVSEGTVHRSKPSNDDDDLVGILVPTFIAIAIVIILVVLFVVFYTYKRRKIQKHEESLRNNGSDITSSSTNSLYHRSSSTNSEGCLPPLPIHSVFGHDRITDHGVGMRSLALPSDSMPQQVDNGKRLQALYQSDPTFIQEATIPLTPETPRA